MRRLLPRRARAGFLVALVVCVAAGCGGMTGNATRGSEASGLPAIHRTDLPAQARRTLRLIRRGGPFPYRRDGAVFENREQRLPDRRYGYYHEYTVRTPGEHDRGPRRIVTSGDGDLYCTRDHYASFRKIVR